MEVSTGELRPAPAFAPMPSCSHARARAHACVLARAQVLASSKAPPRPTAPGYFKILQTKRFENGVVERLIESGGHRGEGSALR